MTEEEPYAEEVLSVAAANAVIAAVTQRGAVIGLELLIAESDDDE